MTYLLDTNVISEPGRARPSHNVLRWLAQIPSRDAMVSVMTIGELRKGAEQLRPRDASRAAELGAWIAETVAGFGTRIVAVDGDIAQAWGRLEAIEPRPKVDGLIAATALARGWTVATRNTRDFERMGVETYNPFGD